MTRISMQEFSDKCRKINEINSLFAECIEIILKNEGGYSDNPVDPGGETNFGIAKRYYPQLDIKNLTREKAIDIYYCDYWLKMNLRNIYNENLVLQIFDCGVNCGIVRAIKMIQGLVSVEIDGIIGIETEIAINDPYEDLLTLYKQERKRYYFNLVRIKPELAIFLKGWMNRVDKTKFA